ncbi:MAG: 50S ribosomal protein L17 [Bacteroidetes bacterium]|nr:50S ribosomal protein L17 [Bacteroidota bacterium]
MRHGVKNNHLGRKTPHRKALLRNLACQLIQYKRIVTTLAKAKALRVFVEPILTKAKTDDTHQRRTVFSYLQDKEAIKELFGTVSNKIGDRPGGYCRIIKLERRLGDAADMAMIELVDFNEIYNATSAVGEEKKKTRRSRAAKKVATPAAPAAVVAETPVAAAPVAEAAVEETPVVETVVEETAPVVEASTEDASNDAPATDETNEEKADA